MAKTFEEKMVDKFCFSGVDGSVNRCKYYIDLNTGVLELGHVNRFKKKTANISNSAKGIGSFVFKSIGAIIFAIVFFILVLVVIFKENDLVPKLLLATMVLYSLVDGAFRFLLGCCTPKELIKKIKSIRSEQRLSPAWFGKLVSTDNTSKRLNFINEAIVKLQGDGVSSIVGIDKSDIPVLNQLKNQLENNLEYTCDRDAKVKAVASEVVETPKAISQVASKVGTAAYDYTVSCDKGLQQKEIRKLKEEKIALQRQLAAGAEDIIDVEVKPDDKQDELRKFTDEEILKMVKG